MADVPADLNSWSATASSNSPTDATTIGSGLADNLQALQAVVRGYLAAKGSDIASSANPDVAAVQGLYHDITGSNTIVGLGTTATAGIWKILQFDGSPLLKHSTALQMVTAADVTAQPGAVAAFFCEASNQWRNLFFSHATVGSLVPAATTVQAGVVELATTAEVQTGTDALRAVTASALQNGKIVNSTVRATTSGTAFDFTSIPSWVKMINVGFAGVSTSGGDDILVQVGNSGGMTTAGYVSDSGRFTATTQATGGVTSGFNVSRASAASAVSGTMQLHLMDSSTNTWVASHSGTIEGAEVVHGGGNISLASVLTQVRVTRSGTDTFDAGKVNVTYE